MKTKICTKCGVEKSEDEFYLYPNGKVRPSCKLCASLYARENINKPGVRERYNKIKIEWIKNHPQDHKTNIARTKVARALKSGHLPKSKVPFIKTECAMKDGTCSTNMEFHHTNGYNKPYEGVWLCCRHHKITEYRIKRSKNVNKI